MIRTVAEHFPKHCHLKTTPTPKPKWQNLQTKMERESLSSHQSSHYRVGRGAARELRVGSRDSQPGRLMGKIWKRRGELRAGGRGPRGGCARGVVGSVASCSSPAAYGARSAPAPAQGPRLRRAVKGRRANLLPATNVTFQEKPVPLGKFNFSPLKPDSFKSGTNSEGELSLTPQFLRNLSGENKGAAANAIRAPGSGARPPGRPLPPEPRLPRGAGRVWPGRRIPSGGPVCAPLSRAEGSGHRRPASAPSLGRRETRARARPRECRHMAAPSGKASPASGARPHTGTPAQRAHTTSRLGWGAGRRGDPTRRTGGLQGGAGTEFRFFFFLNQSG